MSPGRIRMLAATLFYLVGLLWGLSVLVRALTAERPRLGPLDVVGLVVLALIVAYAVYNFVYLHRRDPGPDGEGSGR